MLTTKNQGEARLSGSCYTSYAGIMKHDKKILTLPRVLHIMRYIQIVWQLYCIPACTFLGRSELRRTAEYAT
jgi:hypothetical protein